MRMSLSNASNPVKVLLLIGVLISPWLFSQAVIFVIASDQEIESMPICESNSGNCAHLGGGRTTESITHYQHKLTLIPHKRG